MHVGQPQCAYGIGYTGECRIEGHLDLCGRIPRAAKRGRQVDLGESDRGGHAYGAEARSDEADCATAGPHLCGKQGLYGRPARLKRLIGRGWPSVAQPAA
eukprot:scaffold113194_cov61-Phaeocystis_antarctica.AAC.1